MRIRKEIEAGRVVEDAFAYVADFSNAAKWDPGIAESTKTTEGPVRKGSEFDVVALFRGKQHRFHYVVTAVEQDRRVVLSGDGERARSIDEIIFEPAGNGVRITYVADFHLKGVFRPAAPLLAPVLSRMGDQALESLKAVLDRPS